MGSWSAIFNLPVTEHTFVLKQQKKMEATRRMNASALQTNSIEEIDDLIAQLSFQLRELIKRKTQLEKTPRPNLIRIK
jgi:hypothetical protein